MKIVTYRRIVISFNELKQVYHKQIDYQSACWKRPIY